MNANDTIKAIRSELKNHFPGIKFSVTKTRSLSCAVEWQDGPNNATVEAAIGKYEGEGIRYVMLNPYSVHP